MQLLELNYLSNYIQYRLDILFNKDNTDGEPKIPALNKWKIHIPSIIIQNKASKEEKILLLLALCPHIDPNLLDKAFQGKLSTTGDYPQIGGIRGKNYRGFLPTGETALFLLAGEDFEKRIRIYNLLSNHHFFAKNNILSLEDPIEGEPRMSGRLIISEDYIDLFKHGKINKPKFSMKFPAELISTEMNWEDLILNDETNEQLNELKTWLEYGDTLLYDYQMHTKFKPGYRVLFHGPPGTGKTLAATLLAKYTDKDVYKIDLSMVVSKFIGETEKNLSNLLNSAEKTGGILFFDEADALFGKRTNVRDAHDKYANQEVSYLLQRIENYKGLVILASNLKSNIDDAFVRRFQAIINFPMPKYSERHKIWQMGFPKGFKLDKAIDITQIAQKYELSGAEIMNIIHYACLKVLSENKKTVLSEYLVKGIQREYNKSGKIMR